MSQAGGTSGHDADRRNAEALLCAEVISDAQREADELLQTARTQAEEIVAAAERKAEAIRKETAESAFAEATVQSGFIQATVPLEQARLREARVEALLQGLRSEARDRLCARHGFDWIETDLRLAAEALARMAGSDFTLTLCARDHSVIAPRLTGELRERLQRADLHLEVEAAPGWSECGVIIQDRDRRRLWDNRVTARLERLWPAMRRELARWTGLASTGGPP